MPRVLKSLKIRPQVPVTIVHENQSTDCNRSVFSQIKLLGDIGKRLYDYIDYMKASVLAKKQKTEISQEGQAFSAVVKTGSKDTRILWEKSLLATQREE
jgi:hypothetical protein